MPDELKALTETLRKQLLGIHIAPGQWRPIFPCEQIAWVTPPWLSMDYPWPYKDFIYLDFPEGIFVEGKRFYLSHENPHVPAVFPDLPKVAWRVAEGGIAFERELPNRVSFGGSVKKRDDSVVALELFIRNGSGATLRDIRLQTCAYLRAITEFTAFTNDNKFVHVADGGWIPLSEAPQRPDGSGRYRIGFRGLGPAVADLPVLAARSAHAERLVAMTWGEHTASLVGNPRHPCLHADPVFPDLAPGEEAAIRGKLVFLEGALADLERALGAGS